jgi:hypothetical protein
VQTRTEISRWSIRELIRGLCGQIELALDKSKPLDQRLGNIRSLAQDTIEITNLFDSVDYYAVYLSEELPSLSFRELKNCTVTE